jgi:hypothetical protein
VQAYADRVVGHAQSGLELSCGTPFGGDVEVSMRLI